MTYDELDEIVDDAWLAFFNVFKDNGLDIHKIEQAMDNKDCFNDVEDAIMNAVHTELEGE
jgi:DNA-binding transcriptional MerR regulator